MFLSVRCVQNSWLIYADSRSGSEGQGQTSRSWDSAGFQLDWNLLRTFFPSSPNFVRTFWNFLGHFFNTTFYHHKRKLPSALLKLKPGLVLLPFRMVSAVWLIVWLFSSPEPKAHGWANSIPVTPASVRRLSSVRPQFQTSSPLKPLGQSNSNFIWRLLRTRERKFVQMVLVTWLRWPPRPYMVKSFKNLLLQNQKADDLGTWYVALGMWGLPSLFKWWS